jgi:hypothetical protein
MGTVTKHPLKHKSSHQHDDEGVMHFFQRASSFLVIIPLALMAYIILSFGNGDKTKSPTASVPIDTNNQTKLPTPEQTPYIDEGMKSLFAQVNAEMNPSEKVLSLETEKSIQTLDLEGPWVCENDAINIYVKQKNIKVVFSEQKIQKHLLVNGDCAYEWSGNSDGVKQCGIGVYLDLLAPFISSDPARIVQITKSLRSEMQNQIDVDSVIASCKKLPVDNSLFTVPQGIKWTEQSQDLF